MADPRARPAPSDSPPLAGAVRSAVPRDSGGTPRDDASPTTLSDDVTTDGDDGDDAATHYRAASAAGGGMLQRRRRGGLSGVVGRRERVEPPAEGGRRTCSELRESTRCAHSGVSEWTGFDCGSPAGNYTELCGVGRASTT